MENEDDLELGQKSKDSQSLAEKHIKNKSYPTSPMADGGDPATIGHVDHSDKYDSADKHDATDKTESTDATDKLGKDVDVHDKADKWNSAD